MTQKTFAEYLGMSQAALSSIFNGRTKPTLNTVEAIRSKMPDISLEWLISGVGEMYASTQKTNTQDTKNIVETPQEQEFDFDAPVKSIIDESKKASKPDGVESTLKNTPQIGVKISDKRRRRITEIRVFYDDRTYESFVPKIEI